MDKLKSFDEIRIVSPAGNIAEEYIDGAKKLLQSWGLTVSEGRFARTAFGRFAGTKEQRAADLQQALDDPNVKAILCSRGGYGLMQIVDRLDFFTFLQRPKWIIGFSDITVLHSILSLLDVPSVHGVMAKHLTEQPANDISTQHLKQLLFGDFPTYKLPSYPLNRVGKVQGKLIGGNLSVFMGLRGTSFDLQFNNSILFIEDIGEPLYKIDRMMQNLHMSGALEKLSGLIVGQFTDCDEDEQMKQTVYEIIAEAVSGYDYPVCFNFPAGHVDYNLPLIMGKEVNLQVSETEIVVKI